MKQKGKDMLKLKDPLKILNWSIFFQTQIFMLPVMLFFYQANGLTKGDFFLFQGIFSISALLFEVPAGYIADWVSRKKILILSYSLFIGRLLLWSFFGGYWIVLAGEILYAASKAFLSGVTDGYIYDLLQARGKTHAMLKRYGRFNFFMSMGTALASVVGAMFYEKFGIMTVIGIELLVNTIALCLLFPLPNVPAAKRQKMTMKEKYIDLFAITKRALTSDRIKYYITYSAMAVAASMIFVWSFQPLMQAALIPAGLFGIVYFINHALRAISSFSLQDVLRLFPLKRLGMLVYGFHIISFFCAIGMLHIKSVPINFALMFFICVSIALQLAFTLASVSRIHTFITSDIRATVLSVNNMISRLATGVVLIMFKFLLDGVNMQTAFIIYLLMFVTSIYPLIRLVKQPDTPTAQ